MVMLNPLSLPILLELCRHPDLSKYVRLLTVSCEHIEDPVIAHEQCLLEMQNSMRRSDLDLLLLTEAIRSLPTLETVQIHSGFISFRHPRDPKQCTDFLCGLRLIEGHAETRSNKAVFANGTSFSTGMPTGFRSTSERRS